MKEMGKFEENEDPFFEVRLGEWHLAINKTPKWPVEIGKRIALGIGIGIGIGFSIGGMGILSLVSDFSIR
ncbi:hypothetical protein [Streptomyces sp. BV129]|uniref:hypothetical protein n=1 Tax=Streptomyces sp. BV129 TaxID=2849671 RepID=UPI001C2E1883|nr:hypothetical protein [Streptomyces sp. BV129]MBV1949346.1 hypothetical protein [Streptomyces sp. BV129]MBV1949467.1 hypothetical protein [Streptomyces sp. BV129]